MKIKFHYGISDIEKSIEMGNQAPSKFLQLVFKNRKIKNLNKPKKYTAMKRILFQLFLLLVAINLLAQIPQKMSYQAIIRNSSDKLIINSNIAMRISLLQGSVTGMVAYSETHSAKTNANGLVSFEIGGGLIVSGNFNTVDWSAGPYFLKTETDPAGGTNYSITGTSQLLNVPYSLYSKTAETIKGGISETDPIFLASPANTISTEKISEWNNQLDSVSKIPSGDSLVLRDNQGVIRMVMNPNTGTFKMMNDDTVWYSISVNSPYEKVSYDNQGNKIVQGENSTKIYSPEGKLMCEETKNSQPDRYGSDAFYETTKTYYDASGNVSKVVNDFDGSHERSLTITEYKDGNKIEKSTSTDIWGKTTVTEKLNNQFKYKEITQNDKKEISKFNEDGSCLRVTTYIENSKLHTITTKLDREGNVIYENHKIDDPEKNGSAFNNLVSQQVTGTTTTFVQNTSPFGANWYFETNGVKYPQLNFNQSCPENPGYNISVTNNGTFGSGIKLGQNGLIELQPNYPNGYTSNNGAFKSYGTFTNYGNAIINGSLNTSGTKNFRIEYPLDTTKYLVHASIESNEVLNKYSGNIVTDQNGEATVNLPDFFESINTDFRYQLTVIGIFAQAIVADEIKNNRFLIKTDKPNVKVSWEVTGKRNDKYIIDNPFEAVVEK